MNPLISVIIPVYNVENYLDGCVQSVLSQTYTNLEIILVDDGSPDRCGDLCDAYAKQDSRIRVIHKTNGGLSDARNAGIEQANGEWLSFLDSDDTIALNCIETLFQMTQVPESPQITSISYLSVDENGTPIGLINTEETIHVISSKEALKWICYNRELTNSACGKLFHRSLFSDIRFPVGKLYEDIGTFYRLAAKSPYVATNSGQMYFYMQRSDSIMHTHFSLRHLDALQFTLEMLSFYQKNYPDLVPFAEYRVCVGAFEVIQKTTRSQTDMKDAVAKSWALIKKYRGHCLHDPNAGFDHRCLAIVSYLGIGFTRFAWNAWVWIKWHVFRKGCV